MIAHIWIRVNGRILTWRLEKTSAVECNRVSAMKPLTTLLLYVRAHQLSLHSVTWVMIFVQSAYEEPSQASVRSDIAATFAMAGDLVINAESLEFYMVDANPPTEVLQYVWSWRSSGISIVQGPARSYWSIVQFDLSDAVILLQELHTLNVSYGGKVQFDDLLSNLIGLPGL